MSSRTPKTNASTIHPWEVAFQALREVLVKEIAHTRSVLAGLHDTIGDLTSSVALLDTEGSPDNEGWPDVDKLTVEQRCVLTGAADAHRAISCLRANIQSLDELSFMLGNCVRHPELLESNPAIAKQLSNARGLIEHGTRREVVRTATARRVA